MCVCVCVHIFAYTFRQLYCILILSGGVFNVITKASISLYSGRELFLSDSSLFVDDAEDKYRREEESDASEQKVDNLFFHHFSLFCNCLDNLYT